MDDEPQKLSTIFSKGFPLHALLCIRHPLAENTIPSYTFLRHILLARTSFTNRSSGSRLLIRLYVVLSDIQTSAGRGESWGCKLRSSSRGMATCTHLQETQGKCDSGQPRGFIFQKPNKFVRAAVKISISGYRVPALVRQRFPQHQVIVGTAGTATTDLQTEACVLPSVTPKSSPFSQYYANGIWL